MARRAMPEGADQPPNRGALTRSRSRHESWSARTCCSRLKRGATDPPFKKGKDFHATPDSLAAGARFQDRWSWQRDVHDDWVDQITDDEPHVMNVINGSRKSYGDDMGAFLCFMAVRLLEMRRVLRDDGSIYLHCDPTASHYLKELMDAIFGKRQFRNEIVWCYTGPGNFKRWFPGKHDIILFYTKGTKWTFNHDDERLRLPYKLSLTMGSWQQSKGGDHTTGLKEQFEKGKLVEDWWEIPRLANSSESTGYPTQKPLSLYERIIVASSNDGDIVLDPFCGCATTPIAAERLGRQWVGIDIWDGAYDRVIERLESEGLAGPEGTSDRLFTFGDLTYSTELPVRTDNEEVAAPYLPAPQRRASEAWQRLSHKEIVTHLEQAQAEGDGVTCGGCGRTLEREFMQLDHITPRAGSGGNDITNRILLCQPCNGRKRDHLTLPGLLRENKKTGWMRNETLARIVQEKASASAERVKNELS